MNDLFTKQVNIAELDQKMYPALFLFINYGDGGGAAGAFWWTISRQPVLSLR